MASSSLLFAGTIFNATMGSFMSLFRNVILLLFQLVFCDFPFNKSSFASFNFPAK